MAKAENNKIKRSYQDKIFDIVNLILMIVLFFIFMWPLWFVLIASVSDPGRVLAGEVWLLPKDFMLDGYKAVFEDASIVTGYRNTLFYTVVGTVLNVIMTVCGAYPLSRKDFVLRKFVFYMLLITMYFNGGLIPTYITMKKLGIVNTVWAMIIPGIVSWGNILIVRNYFQNNISDAYYEATTLDGANSFQYLVKIALPLSRPIIAVITLYYAVAHWNDYFTALIYILDDNLAPLQTALRNILWANTNNMDASAISMEAYRLKVKKAEILKYAVIVVSSLPPLIAYPFVQKHFIRGLTAGGVKE